MKLLCKWLKYLGIAVMAAIAFIVVVRIYIGGGDRYGPFDGYKVLRVVKNPRAEMYAIVVAYHHGNSSADVTAVWIGENAPPIGSTEPLPGWPSFVSQNDAFDLEWGQNGHLVVKTPAPVEIGRDCYFSEAPLSTNLVCPNLEIVDVLIVK
jgi:hypothetical protein